MVLFADILSPCGWRKRVLHLHAFESLDRALNILAGLVSGRFDRLLDREDIFPGLPAITLVHHARAADLARVFIIDAHALEELLVILVVLGLEHAREIFEEVHAFRRALHIGWRN